MDKQRIPQELQEKLQDPELREELLRWQKQGEAYERAMAKRKAILDKYRPLMAPYMGKALELDSEEAKEIERLKLAEQDELYQWKRKYGIVEGQPAPKTLSELIEWAEEQLSVFEMVVDYCGGADPVRVRKFYRRALEYANGIKPIVKFPELSETSPECILEYIRRRLQEWREKAGASQNRHSPDFREVIWFGQTYHFTAIQAACVKILWKAWCNGTPDISQDYVLVECGSGSGQLKDVFKGNSAWMKMIVPGKTKGTYRLEN